MSDVFPEPVIEAKLPPAGWMGTATSYPAGLMKPTKPVVHSWSSIVEFNNCAWRWYLSKIEKSIPFEQTEELREGNIRHKALEEAVRDGAPLPFKYQQDKPMVDAIIASQGIKLVEWQWGLDRNWNLTGFFANDVWIRGKIDIAIVGTKHAFNGDYKTGKVKEDDGFFGQLDMFTIPMFVRYPHLETVKSAYLWLGNDKTSKPKIIKSEELPSLKEHASHRIFRIEDAVKRGVFSKTPSGLCRKHCPVPRARCEYQGRDI